MKTFGKIISEARKALGLSQKDLAHLIKKEDDTAISPQYLNDIEHDRRNPPSEFFIEQLATQLKLSKDYLCLVAGTIPDDIKDLVIAGGSEKAEQVIRAFRRTGNKK